MLPCLARLLVVGAALAVLVPVPPASALPTDANKPPPIRIHVHAARPADDFTPIDLRDRQDSARDVAKHLKRLSGFGTRLRSVLRVADTPEDADVVVNVTGREARDELRTINAVLVVKGRTFALTGTNDDSDWSDAGRDLAERLVQWVRDNRVRIVESNAKPEDR